MREEFDHWQLILVDFANSPANGIRGKGSDRRIQDQEADANLKEIFHDRLNRERYAYLRAIGHRMPDPTI